MCVNLHSCVAFSPLYMRRRAPAPLNSRHPNPPIPDLTSGRFGSPAARPASRLRRVLRRLSPYSRHIDRSFESVSLRSSAARHDRGAVLSFGSRRIIRPSPAPSTQHCVWLRFGRYCPVHVHVLWRPSHRSAFQSLACSDSARFREGGRCAASADRIAVRRPALGGGESAVY